MNNYKEKTFYTDLKIICNDNVELYYSKYSLVILTDYFKNLLCFNTENMLPKDEIKLDLESKTVIMLLHWSDKKKLNIKNIYVENLIELWDFVNEILCKRFSKYLTLFIIENLNIIVEHHDIGLIFIKSFLHMKMSHIDKVKDFCIKNMRLFLKSTEIKNLNPEHIDYLSDSWDIYVQLVSEWVKFNNNINKISEIEADCNTMDKDNLIKIKDIINNTKDVIFLRQICTASINHLKKY